MVGFGVRIGSGVDWGLCESFVRMLHIVALFFLCSSLMGPNSLRKRHLTLPNLGVAILLVCLKIGLVAVVL